MPAYDTLPSDWQTELEKKVGANPYLELIYDPTNKNISLTGKYSVFDVGTIKNIRDIDPEWGTRSSIAEIQISCHDPDNYLNPESTSSPFHNAMGLLYAQAASGQKVIKIDRDDVTFAAGEVLTINDGTNSESVTVASFVTYGGWHQITAADNLTNTYAADTAIYTYGSEYKDMLLRMRFSGLTNWVTLYWGKLLRISHYNGHAVFVVTDRRKLKMDQTLVKANSSSAKKLKWIDTTGALANSITWNAESAGTLDRTQITVKDACRLGRWTFTFDTKTTYTVTGPGVEGETGGIAVDQVQSLSLSKATTGINGASDVFVSENYAYVVSNVDDSFRIYDITDPTAPVLKATKTEATFMNGPNAIKVIGNYAYICCGDSRGIIIYDCSTKTAPVKKGAIRGQTNLEGAEDIDVIGNYAYVVASISNTLSIWDISNVNVIVEKSNTAYSVTNYLDGACSIKVVGDYAYIASRDDDALTIFNISSPTSPVHTGYLAGASPAEYLNYAQGVDVDGNYAYVCGGGDDALVVIDVTDPSNPARVGQLVDATNLNGTRAVHVLGDYAYITCEDGDSIAVVDISTKTAPSYVCSLSGAGSPNYLDEVRGIFAKGSYVYAASHTDDALVIATITALTSSDFDNDQITVPIDAWGGSINTGDSVTFCTGISWENTNPVQAVYDFFIDRVTVENRFLDCSSYFGDKEIGTLNANASAGATSIQVKVWVPTLIKTGETLSITEGATSEDVTVATGVAATTCYPPYITLTVSTLSNSYTTAAEVTWKQRGSLDTDFSFDAEYSYCNTNSIALSLTLERVKAGDKDNMTKQQALETLVSHFDGFCFQDNWGREKLHSYRLRSVTPGTIAYNTNLKLPNPELELRELINKFRFKWGYDYVNEEFLYETVYPSDDDTNNSNLRYGFIREIEVKLPGIFDSDIIDLIKVNKYAMWKNGINIIRFSTTLQGLVAMIGDHFNLTSLYPALSTEIEIIGVDSMSVTGKFDIQLIAWDYEKVFG